MFKKYTHACTAGALLMTTVLSSPVSNAAPRDVSHSTSAEVRLEYLSRMLDSKSGQRLKALQPETARKVEEMLASGRQAVANGDEEQANALGKNGLKIIMQAVQKMPENPEEIARNKERYENLHQGLSKFVNAQKTNMERFGNDSKGAYDEQQVDALFSSANVLAEQGKYQDAITQLNEAQGILTASLQGLLNNKEFVIELDISTPEKEWAYEARRYSGYEPLIPIALEVKRPAPFVAEKMLKLGEKAKWMSEQAQIKADAQDYPVAIRMMMDATDVLRQALRLAGVMM